MVLMLVKMDEQETEQKEILPGEEEKKPTKLVVVSAILILVVVIAFSAYLFWPKAPEPLAPKAEPEAEVEGGPTKGEIERLAKCAELTIKAGFLPICYAKIYENASYCSELNERGKMNCEFDVSLIEAASSKNISKCDKTFLRGACKFMFIGDMTFCSGDFESQCMEFLNFDPNQQVPENLSRDEQKSLDEKLEFYALRNDDLSICEKISFHSFSRKIVCRIAVSKSLGVFKLEEGLCEGWLDDYCLSLPPDYVIGSGAE